MSGLESFGPEHRAVLERVLGTTRRETRPLSYPQIAGFLCAVVACPDTVQPSEWLEATLGDDRPAGTDEADLEAFIHALMALNNHASEQLFADEQVFPPGCEPPEDPAALGEDTHFGQFAEGLLIGHDWLRESWENAASDEQQADVGAMLGMLNALRGHDIAASILRDAEADGQTVPHSPDEMLSEILPDVRVALAGYFDIALEVREATEAAFPHEPEAPEPYRRQTPRVGRNEPCPCGSGRKYKRCCGQRTH